MPPLITVIIPTYNRADLLARALASVAAQTYRPIEVIVIDDGSSDGTADSIPGHRAALARDGIELTFHAQSNAGPAAARNNGIARCHGSLICFLDSDDMWKPAFAATLASLLESHPSAGLAFGGYLSMDMQERIRCMRPTHLPAEPAQGLLVKPFDSIVEYMPFGTPCVMIRRSVLDDVGIFDTDYYIGEDWDLWFRISLKYDFVYTLEGLTCCREHANNMVKHDSRAICDRIRLAMKCLGSISDPQKKIALEARIRDEIVLLQEQVLREGKSSNGAGPLLEHPLAPHTMRFKLGEFISHQPRWIGRAYAAAIRAAGGLQRSTFGP